MQPTRSSAGRLCVGRRTDTQLINYNYNLFLCLENKNIEVFCIALVYLLYRLECNNWE